MQRIRVEVTARRRVLQRRLPFALLPVALAAAPAHAQRDSVVVRAVSSWQSDVDRLKQELLSQRRLEFEFGRTLGTLQARLRVTPADSERIDLQARTQLVFSKLREASAAQFRIRRQIESLCASVTRPEGWLGVATTGFLMLDRQVDGPQVVRFMERPVVESVDPGSPAARVGVRAGDVLLEIGGKTLLHNDVVFADLLRPGERIAVKLQRGREVLTVTPTVEPAPVTMSVTQCALVDPGTAYVISPVPVGQAFQVEVESGTEPARPRFAFSGRLKRDSSRADEVPVAPSGTSVFAGPLAYTFGAGASVLAGLQLVALNRESSRALGVSHGLFVNQVVQGTPGREAGLQGGDVLVTADTIELRSVGSLQRALRLARDRSVDIVIVRGRKQETVRLKW